MNEIGSKFRIDPLMLSNNEQVLSLAVNTSLLCSIMVKGTKQEKENLFEIACRFLENRLRPKAQLITFEFDYDANVAHT